MGSDARQLAELGLEQAAHFGQLRGLTLGEILLLAGVVLQVEELLRSRLVAEANQLPVPVHHRAARGLHVVGGELEHDRFGFAGLAVQLGHEALSSEAREGLLSHQLQDGRRQIEVGVRGRDASGARRPGRARAAAPGPALRRARARVASCRARRRLRHGRR